MMPNLMNTVLGILLVYCAVLAPAPLNDTVGLLLSAGGGIIALGFWARASDRLNWFNLLNACLGAALFVLGLARIMVPVHPVVMFWWVFWVGIIVAVLAFWSAIYNRDMAV